MAIVNVTPDSFSDGGDNFNVDVDALASSTMELLDVTGATIVDVGGQSSKPGAMEVSEEEELRRTVPMIRALRSAARTRPLCISIDTYRARVAAEAVGAGADLVNDVSGGTLDRAMLATVAKLGASICLTHMRGTPSTMTQLTQYPEGIVPTVARELSARVQAAEAAGIRRWRILVDPGIGFAKTQAQNLELLRDLHLLRDWSGLQGLPWLVGPSRKAFIGRITGVAEPRDRIWGTAAAISAAVAGGADIVRVHDVAHMAQVVKMADAIWRHGR
ncbi:MAG: trifunctional dihydropteroate synthetase [Thelocarpon superellum]|nr:MAG: trifunctional dihydropteroate synthetase [Thelocarpon superellum]